MIHEDDAHCFPICRGCREAGVCHLGPSLAVLQAEAPKRQPWKPNDLKPIVLLCGHLSLPWPEVLDKILKITQVWCDKCGQWNELPQEPPKKASRKKSKEEVKGQLDMPTF